MTSKRACCYRFCEITVRVERKIVHKPTVVIAEMGRSWASIWGANMLSRKTAAVVCSSALALAGCGLDAAGSAATAATGKAQELQQVAPVQQQVQQSLQRATDALEQRQQQAEAASEAR